MPVGFITGVDESGKRFTCGPYVFTDLGRIVAGPFDSVDDAYAWINEGCDLSSAPRRRVPKAAGKVSVLFLSAGSIELTIEELLEEIVQIGGDRY